MGVALAMILAGVLPMPIVFLMRSFQCLKVDLDIHQGSIRRNETTASTKEMIDNDDDDVSLKQLFNLFTICVYTCLIEAVLYMKKFCFSFL